MKANDGAILIITLFLALSCAGCASENGTVVPETFALVHAIPPVARPGTSYSFTFSATGGQKPYGNWQVVKGALPDGFTLDTSSGTLTGTPQAEGFAYFVLQAEDAGGTGAMELYGIRLGEPGTPGPMKQKAEAYQTVYEARHLWHGLSLNAMKPDAPDHDYQLSTYGDCAFQSGQCTAAMSFRYAVEKSPASLDLITEIIDGWRFFQRLTGVPGLIGRSFAHKDDPSENGQWDTLYPETDKHQGTGEFADYFWQADTSRDQMTGAVLGNALAFDLVDNEHVRQTAAIFLTEVADHVWDHGMKIVDPDGEMTTHGDMNAETWNGLPVGDGLNAVCSLAWFKVAHHVSGEQRFGDYYQELAIDHGYLDIMQEYMWVYQGYQTKYYNAYMAWENIYMLMRLEQEPALNTRIHDIFRDTLWLNTDDTTENRRGVKEANPVKTTWYLASTGEHDPLALYDALWQITVFPDTPLRDRHVENSINPDIEKNPERSDEAMYPLPAYLRKPDMVIWHRNPFELDGGADSGEERTGCDYLLPYWMGRYYGFIGEDW